MFLIGECIESVRTDYAIAMKERHDAAGEIVDVEHADVLGVDGGALLLIEARRIRVDIFDVERLNHFLSGENVIIRADRPAQQCQVIQQAFTNHAVFAVQQQIRLRVTLGQLLVPFTHHIGQVAKTRRE